LRVVAKQIGDRADAAEPGEVVEELPLVPIFNDGEEIESGIAVEAIELQAHRAQSDQSEGLAGPGERGADLVQAGEQEGGGGRDHACALLKLK
jgi:hypothetical protein